MSERTDSDIIEEVKNRFEEKNKALFDLRMMTRKLEEVNRKLLESEALKSDFLSNIRNEINNPLTSILVMSNNMASMKAPGCEECASMGCIIYAEAFNLDFQLRNIFAAAEIEAGEASPFISNVDIHRFILDLIDSYKHVADKKLVAITFDQTGESMSPTAAFFKTDPSKLQLIVSNLLSNAIKYSREGGSVTVKAWKHNEQLNIAVEDSGIGIDESDRQAIFERFRQLDTGTTKCYLGQGLGLSVAKALVELLDGTISVASIGEKGSIFTVVIPEAKSEGDMDIFSEEGNEFLFDEGETF